MIAWLNHLRQIAQRNEACVLITVAGTRGSTPRETGTKMIVTASETIGTIGGGQLEHQCVRIACDALRAGVSGRCRLQRFPLGANCGQCCGGVAEILFEEMAATQPSWVAALLERYENGTPATIVTARQSMPEGGKLIVTADGYFAHGDCVEPVDDLLSAARHALEPGVVACQGVSTQAGGTNLPILIEPVSETDFHIVLFGAGHVGAACVKVLSTLDARIDLVDNRPDVFDVSYPANVRVIFTADPGSVAAASPPGSYNIVMTHDHALDFEICARLLPRRDLAYCGLIGSVSKRRRFEKRFRALGLGSSDIAGLTCPIGSNEITGKHPAQIAIGLAAQLLGMREQAELARAAENGEVTGGMRARKGIVWQASR